MTWVGSLVQPHHGGWSSCNTCHFVVRLRDLFLPFRVVSGVEQGSVGTGQASARCSDLCLSEIATVTAHFFQIFF